MSWIHARWILVASWQNSNVHRQNKACFLSSRALLIRLIDLTNGNSKPFFKIGMTKEVKKELNVLECFLETFNGSSIFLPNKWSSSHELKSYTYVSSSISYAVVFGGQWFYGNWELKSSPNSCGNKSVGKYVDLQMYFI